MEDVRSMEGLGSFRIRAFDACDAQLVVLVPECFAGLLSNSMFGMRPPFSNGFKARPIRHSDSKPIRAADAFDAEIARLTRSKFSHSIGHLAVAVLAWSALRREDYRVVRRLGKLGERGCCHFR